mmetsp:Transcript_34778/g.73185  ORF Transcript_34778/g.73185 Transcript_34778/m.73185 type:complete len:403 (+) Transcript_34778:122-1330(+)
MVCDTLALMPLNKEVRTAPGFACPWRAKCNNSWSSMPALSQSCRRHFLNSLSNRTLMFIGDSLSRQHFYGLVCDLWPLTSDATRSTGSGQFEVLQICNAVVSTISVPAFNWSSPRLCETCCNLHCIFIQKTRLCYAVASKSNAPTLSAAQTLAISQRFLGPGDFIVVNIGVQWGPKTVAARTRELLRRYLSLDPSLRPRMIWRESGPQHFVGGEYSRTKNWSRACVPLRPRTLALPTFNYRNKITNPIVAVAGVPILKIFDSSLPYHSLHKDPRKDCTHWCLDGHHNSGVLSLWNDKLAALLLSHPALRTEAATNITAQQTTMQAEGLDVAIGDTPKLHVVEALGSMHGELCNALNCAFRQHQTTNKLLSLGALMPCNTTQLMLQTWRSNPQLWVVRNDYIP